MMDRYDLAGRLGMLVYIVAVAFIITSALVGIDYLTPVSFGDLPR